MRKILIIFAITIFSCKSWAINGEFLIVQDGGGALPLTLHLVSNEYAYYWDGRVKLAPNYDRTFNDVNFGFDSPKNVNVAKNGVMLWGKMHFTLSSEHVSISFEIDFRDERWSDNYTGGPDIYLHFDPYTGNAYLVPPTGANVIVVTNMNIWDAYHQTTVPLTDSFLEPVFLKNIISGSSAGGTLHVGGSNYSSGDTALVSYGNTYDVGTNNERFVDYLTTGINFKHHDWKNNETDYLITRNVLLNESSNQQYAYFLPISSGAIKVKMLENNSFVDNYSIQFQDPWYIESNGSQSNQFDTYSSPYIPTGAYNQSSGGIFLNQNPTFDPLYPNYSVRISSYQTIHLAQTGKDHKFYFQNWSGSDATFQNANSTTS